MNQFLRGDGGSGGKVSRPPEISLFCLTGESCAVYIEPYGYELTLLRGERFHVESWAITSGALEIGYVKNGIWLGFDPMDAWVIADDQGVERMRFDPTTLGL